MSEQDAGAIVPAELFHAVQREPMPAPKRGPSRWLLTGSCYCGVCASKLETVTTTGGTPRKYHYYRCLNKDCPSSPRPGASAEKLEAWVVETCWTFMGSGLREPSTTPDLKPLADEVERTRQLWEGVRTPEMQEALGDEYAATVTARRLAHEEALAVLGAAESAGAPASVVDLRERWETMDGRERRDALRRYLIARVVVSGPKPEAWEIVWK